MNLEIPEDRPKAGTKEFFLSEPRSAEIRRVCLPLWEVLNDLANSKIPKEEAIPKIKEIQQSLLEAGIIPGVHTGESQGFFENPIHLAEYVAGQLLTIIADNVIAEVEIKPIAGEFSEQSREGAYITRKDSRPKEINDFATIRQVLITLGRFLAIEDDEQ